MSLVCPQEAEQAHHPPGSRPHKPPLNPPATDQKIMLYKPTIAARDPPSVVTLLRCSREHPEWTTLLIGAAACACWRGLLLFEDDSDRAAQRAGGGPELRGKVVVGRKLTRDEMNER